MKNLIFLHIPKNGGTTLTSILTRYFDESNTFNIKVLDSENMNTIDFLSLHNAERKRIRLLTGHMNFGMDEFLEGTSDYITFLRDPVERAVSFFYYSKNDPKNRLYNIIHKNNWTLYEFLKNVKEKDISNAQVRLISGINDNPELMLKKAVENIEKHFSFIGFQEQFDESLIVLCNKYKWSLPYYKKRKVTLNRPLVEDIDAQTINLIMQLNKEDILLYNHCREKFNSHLYSIKNLNIKLKWLRLINRVFGSTKYKKLKMMLSKSYGK